MRPARSRAAWRSSPCPGRWARPPGMLLASRLAEGAGCLLVIVSCPALITRLAGERDRPAALSIWGTFVPVGIGLSTLTGGPLAALAGWRGWAGAVAAVTLALTVLVWLIIPARAEAATRLALPRPRALVRPALLATAFCVISLLTLSVIVLLPTCLGAAHQVAPVDSGLLTSVISLLSVAGGVAVGMALHRGVRLRPLAVLGLITVPAAWVAFADGGGLWTALAGSGLISLGNGLLVAVVFAGLPATLERLEHADVGNGIVAQLGSLGSLPDLRLCRGARSSPGRVRRDLRSSQR
nr:MFS transporter [Nonomuraea typhae]